MKSIIGTLCVLGAYLLPALGNLLLLRRYHPRWWGTTAVRVVLAGATLVGLVSGLAWFYSFDPRPDLAGWLGELAFATLLLQGTLAGSLALGDGLKALYRRLRRRSSPAREFDPRRRRLLQGGLVAAPLLTAGSSAAGLAEAAAPPRFRSVPVTFPDLHPDLEGFRILQISDLHLAAYVTVDDLARLLDRAAGLRVDLLAVTGDLADDLRQVPRAVELLAAFPTTHGAWAILGNHEYGHGAEAFVAAYARSRVRLLRDETVDLNVGGAVLRLGGVDDPARAPWSRRGAPFFVPRLQDLFNRAGHADFNLLLSHRPDALSYADAAPVDLILAGHTHGGQIGFAGRSLLPLPWRYPYPWGRYRNGRTRQYTTSGAGHWIPFRLGCPTEVPVVELRRG